MISASLFNHLLKPFSTDVFTPLTPTQGLYNTRFKYFGDEFTKAVCFSRPIFNPHKLERHKKDKPSKTAPAPVDVDTDAAEPLPPEYTKSTAKRNESRKDNMKRARDTVFEIAYANDFTYFITLTLDETKISRTNKEEIKKALNIWLQNLVQRSVFQYVVCPEYHADGEAIHFHGLCSGTLKLTDSGTVLVSGMDQPISVSKANRLGLQGKPVYNLDNWKYGFSTAVPLDEQKERTAVYITKYITKDTDKIIGRYYYSGGKGLIRTVPTEYRNYPFCEFDGQERTVVDGYLAVKYNTF